ncbi:hypothetical protein IV203_020079 [Nitzschia inconspicua]|uniref:Uncharacterized protein n=1 Tax=Nitzschia inconspicua TaxID=303405 RepID=A0A9K3LZX4_9STRA|nr:hypothetical protein IV203_020448 [Nitzschia inconspicua]KAG7371509.1 hypothetical protein IV203_020079 [Nitzschia inconspicua]
MDANNGNPKHNESINNRKRTIEEVEVFLVPSFGDELFDRVWAEASLSSSSSLQNDDHSSSSSVRDGFRQLCHDFMPCNTLQRLHQMFHVFVDAILYAVLGAYSSPTLPTLKTGEQIHRQLAWKLKNDSCQWVLISATVKGPLPSRKQWSISQTLRNGVTVLSTVVGGSSPCLYAVSAVGSGATSIVYRVITEEGYEGVAKVYTGALENERANRLTDIERKVFNATYPQVPVSKLTVDCYPILLMPYFEHIKQPDETWKEKVMAALRELKGGRARHLKYTDCDVCWRHIGLCRESGQIRLFDFNNMEVIQPTNRIEQEVERQWEILAGYIQQNTEK